MGVGTSIFLIALGAILNFGVNAEVSGLDLDVIGVILMIVGAIGLVVSMFFWSTWGGIGGSRQRRTVVQQPGYVEERRDVF